MDPNQNPGSNSAMINALQSIAAALTGKSLLADNPVMFHANANLGLTATVGWAKMILQAEEHDVGQNYDPTTGLFTAPLAGYYVFEAAADITVNPGEQYIAALYKNGTEYKRGQRFREGGAGSNQIDITVAPPQFYLALGETVAFWIYNGSGGGKAVAGNSIQTYFGGRLVSRV